MTNREAMEIVLEAAGKRAEWLDNVELNPCVHDNEPLTKDWGEADKVFVAAAQMRDYMNDLMREEPSTGCDYGIGG